ncbi:MAG: phage DNA encapsidation protein [Clostridia bacterium]|nr:phage DNA encapsidation protein [Clostridia bacterium]
MSKWFDYNAIRSRNALINFCIAERGVGKTFGATKMVIDRFIKKKKQFIYLRRYKSELQSSVPTFFNAIIAEGIYDEEQYVFTVKHNKFYINGELAGYAIALSTSNILKSSSFPDVDTIIFDEFLIDKGAYHYLPNEPEKLLDVIETIGRLRDIKTFMLGNAISVTNPYFNYFKLALPYNSEFKMFNDGTICVCYASNYEYRERKKSTRFGKLISSVDYGKYAVDNEWLRDSRAFIKKKGKGCHYFFTLSMKGNNYGVWVSWLTDELFVSKNLDPKCPMVLALTSEDHHEGTILARVRNNGWYKNLCEAYREGLLMFESVGLKNEVLSVLNRTLTY